MFKITNIKARQIIDSRANPTLEVDLYLDESMGRVAIPSGASTGKHEALELRDNDKSLWFGKTVYKAIENVNLLAKELTGKYFETQEALDSWLIQRDGTPNKSNLGANVILGISLAFAHAVAKKQNIHLYQYINEIFPYSSISLPSPMFNIMNGGKHANWSTDVQEFMIVMPKFEYPKQLQAACEIFLNLEKILKDKGKSVNVGNEGGFAPGFENNEDALNHIAQAIEKSSYRLGEEVFFCLDLAASEFFNEENGTYFLRTENKKLSGDEWLEVLDSWIKKYPFFSIEDPFAEDDWTMWHKFTEKFGNKLQIVGDDLLVTNQQRVEKAIQEESCNALLVKVNQIGTLTETLNAMKTSLNAGWKNIISHRSGETEDVTISHIAVGTGCGQIKTGAPSRGERTAKYNEILRIAESM